jgi:hypothetical protein
MRRNHPVCGLRSLGNEVVEQLDRGGRVCFRRASPNGEDQQREQTMTRSR